MKNMEYLDNNILVTGGGGFLGKAIVKNLVSKGKRVISLSRHSYPELENIGVRQIHGDISNDSIINDNFSGIDTVYHTAAKADIWGRKDDFFKVNVIGTSNIIKACLKYKVKRLIYTSSPSVVFNGSDMTGVDETIPYAKHFNAFYPETKAIAEKMVRDAACKELKTISLRPHLIWGPGDNHLVPGIIKKAGKLKKIGNGKNLVDTIYIDNAANAHILACNGLIRNPALSGNVYFISQDNPVKLWEMVDHILDAARLDPVSGAVPPFAAWLAGLFFEIFYKILRIDSEPPMTRFVAKELATSHWFDISRAKQDFGYYPEISIKQGLENLKCWLDANKRL